MEDGLPSPRMAGLSVSALRQRRKQRQSKNFEKRWSASQKFRITGESRLRRMKRKQPKKKQAKKKAASPAKATHKRDFEQLLDDAIFGANRDKKGVS